MIFQRNKLTPKSPVLAIIMEIPKMAKIFYRQMPAPRELSQQIPPRAKASMQKPQGGANFLCKSPGVRGGWLWMKLISVLRGRYSIDNTEL